MINLVKSREVFTPLLQLVPFLRCPKMGSAVESAVSLAHRLQFCLEDVEVKTVFCMGPLTTTRACQSRVAIHTTTLAHQLGCLFNGNAQCQSGTPAWLHGRQLHTKQSCDNQRCNHTDTHEPAAGGAAAWASGGPTNAAACRQSQTRLRAPLLKKTHAYILKH